MAKRRDIGLKVHDVEIGKRVYYYSYVGDFDNSEPLEATITGGPCEICGTLCCNIDIRTSVVALDNLSFERVEKKSLSAKKIRAKERYAKWEQADGTYDGITFGEYLKYGLYKD
jgi:hypothetical protein